MSLPRVGVNPDCPSAKTGSGLDLMRFKCLGAEEFC